MATPSNDPISRRDAMRVAALAGTAALVTGRVSAARESATQPSVADPQAQRSSVDEGPQPPGQPGRDYTPVIVPNGWTLPFTVVDGVKVFHLVAEEVDHEFAPGLRARCWGYNGSVHGPVIEAVEGDRVRIFVTNKLAAPTTVHWHGVITPSGMDGVGGLNQTPIRQGETFVYEFTLRQHGTAMYHAHHDEMTQMGMGMVGMFVIHPRHETGPRPDRDFVLQTHEWSVPVGTDRPDPNEMSEFNVLTFNAKVFPGTDPLVIKQGDRVRLRFGNLSAMDHHPIHLHGYAFTITQTDGGPVPASAQYPETTVLVPVGSTRTVEFVADNPGDWAMHCHMTHHVMNQMGHGSPNMIGVNGDGLDAKVRPLLPGYMTMGRDGMGDMGDMGMAMPANSIPMVGGQGPYDLITMGGMFTIVKVRERLPDGYDVDPGWYQPPASELAVAADADVLRRNGIVADGNSAPSPPPRLARTQQATPTQGHANEAGGHGGHAFATTTSATGPAVYTCPMHAEVHADKPGRCPICGMKLVPKV